MTKEREQMIDHLYSSVEPLPDDLQWFILDCLPKYIFRKTRKKRSECFCPECDSIFMKEDAVGGKDTFCPVCGYKGKYRLLPERYIEDKTKIVCAEVLKDGSRALWFYTVTRSYSSNSHVHYNVNADDFALMVFDANNHVYRYKVYRAGYGYPDWHPLHYGTIWDEVWVHPSIQRVFPEYANLAGNYLRIDDYISGIDRTVYRPVIKRYKQFYNVSSNMKGVMNKVNLTYETYRLLQNLHVDESAEVISKFAELNYRNRSIPEIILQHMSFRKMVNYLSKQFYLMMPQEQTSKARMFDKLLHTYKDYLEIAIQDGADLTKKAILFPRDVVYEHRRQIDVRNAERDRLRKMTEKQRKKALAIQNKDLAKVVKAIWKKTGAVYVSNGFAVLFPTTYEEFRYEGNILNHCVAKCESYFKHQIDDESYNKIFFIRSEAEPFKPLYTLEADLKNNRICQLYGFCDTSAPQEIKEFVKKFLDYYIATTFLAEKSSVFSNVS